MEEVKHLYVDDSKDSIEIGTPSKGGSIKVYGDMNKPDDFKKKIENALEVVKDARAKLVAV